MSNYYVGVIINFALGALCLIVAFNKRWRAMLVRLNPYSMSSVTTIVLLLIALLEIYAGIRGVIRLFR